VSEKDHRNSSKLAEAATTLLPPERVAPGHGTPGRSGPGNGNARTHGTNTLRRAVQTLGNRSISRRTKVGRALAAWRSDLLADLGGIDSVSTQELALVEEAVKTKLILDSVDAWLLQQPTLINKRIRGVLPAVRDRQALVSTLRGLLSDLGLKRRSREMPTLGEYLSGRVHTPTPDSATPEDRSSEVAP